MFLDELHLLSVFYYPLESSKRPMPMQMNSENHPVSKKTGPRNPAQAFKTRITSTPYCNIARRMIF